MHAHTANLWSLSEKTDGSKTAGVRSCVFCITGLRNLLLILYPPGNKRDVKQHYKERKGRSKYQRHRQELDCGCHIHRMPDNAIEASVDNLLILLHLDGP